MRLLKEGAGKDCYCYLSHDDCNNDNDDSGMTCNVGVDAADAAPAAPAAMSYDFQRHYRDDHD